MSTEVFEKTKAAETQDARVSERSTLSIPPWNWALVFYFLVIALGAVLRFWDLGSRAQHHDESLHSLYSWYLYSGIGYKHDPLMHGPFKFEATSLLYFIFGDSDYTSRMLSAILGTALIAMPLLLRGYLGRYGAMFASLLLALSPTMLYYSRFARDDIYIAFWNLLLFIGLWKYEVTHNRKYLYLISAVLALSFATKEDTYITVAIFGAYLFVTTAREVLPRVIRGMDFTDLSPRASAMLLIGTLSIPQGVAAVTLLGALPSFSFLKGITASDPLAIGITSAIILVSAGIGLRWNKNEWAKCALIFYGIYIILFTTFFTNLSGFSSGIWGSLHYWLGQHGIQRGGQPWYYYLILLPIYEFLPLVIALIGSVYLAITRGKSILRLALAQEKDSPGERPIVRWGRLWRQDSAIFLVYWLVASIAVYSWAGEKMPWMLVPIALSLILLASRLFGTIFEEMSWSDFKNEKVLTILAVLVFSPVWLPAVLRIGASLPDSWPSFLRDWAPPIILLALVLLASWPSVRSLGAQKLSQTVVAGLFVLMLIFTFRTSWRLNYQNGDVPVEMLVYTQTSPELLTVLRDIDRLAFESGQGKDIRITVDSTDGFTWPWAWYLRDYKNVEYVSLSNLSAPPTGSVLLLSSDNFSSARPHLDKYGEGQGFKHRWWFPEAYRDLTWSGLFESLLSPEEWRKKWDYFLFRKLSSPLGSSNAMAFFPKNFSTAGIASSANAQPSAPSVYPPADLVFGGPNILNNPRDMAVDSSGNLYIVDGGAHRVLKYDSTGKLVAQVGQQGSGDGEFQDPWGIAVDRAGNVYVADTWNHRIQKFNSDLRFVSKWGVFASLENSGAAVGGLYGPRDVAVGPDNYIYVVDTGNKRIQLFSSEGAPLKTFGSAGRGSGQFMEPVGIAFSPAGEIYIADTWNKRIQVFRLDHGYVREFSVSGWQGEGIDNKPYIMVAQNGDIISTDPSMGRVVKYTKDGAISTVIGGYNTDRVFKTPTGIAPGPSGSIYVSDAASNTVVRLAP